jgi:hypothetical protein
MVSTSAQLSSVAERPVCAAFPTSQDFIVSAAIGRFAFFDCWQNCVPGKEWQGKAPDGTVVLHNKVRGNMGQLINMGRKSFPMVRTHTAHSTLDAGNLVDWSCANLLHCQSYTSMLTAVPVPF